MFEGLKIYNLAVKYEFSESTQILAGRKINPDISCFGIEPCPESCFCFGDLVKSLVRANQHVTACRSEYLVDGRYQVKVQRPVDQV